MLPARFGVHRRTFRRREKEESFLHPARGQKRTPAAQARPSRRRIGPFARTRKKTFLLLTGRTGILARRRPHLELHPASRLVFEAERRHLFAKRRRQKPPPAGQTRELGTDQTSDSFQWLVIERAPRKLRRGRRPVLRELLRTRAFFAQIDELQNACLRSLYNAN